MDTPELSDLELDRVSGGGVKKSDTTVKMGMFGTMGWGSTSDGHITVSNAYYTPVKT